MGLAGKRGGWLARAVAGAWALLLAGGARGEGPGGLAVPVPEGEIGLQIGERERREASDPLAAATLVVFNKNDIFSAELAATYAAVRRVPADQVVGLDCPGTEEITRTEYEGRIAEPLRREFLRNAWWRVEPDATGEPVVVRNKIRFVALVRGVPLKIAAAPGYPGDRIVQQAPIGARNEAAVDSELALLGRFSPVLSGVVENPYYRRFTPILDAGLPGLMLVCRLDGPTVQGVRRMIADSLATEREGLYGFCYADIRGIKEEGLAVGDQWILEAAGDAQRRGFPVIADGGGEQFAPGYPMENAALYYGWYSQDLAGAIARADFRFARGAVAVHIHSFSAGTLRDASKGWVGGLVERGAVASVGNVYEPYLGLTNELGVFQQRLRAGMTFAEACHASVRAHSWMNTFVGDPLYRPFRIWNEAIERPAKVPAEWLAYRRGVEAWFGTSRQAGETLLKKEAAALKSGMLWEALGLLQAGGKDLPASYVSFRKAREAYREAEAVARCALHEANLLRYNGKKKESLDLVRKTLGQLPKTRAAAVLRSIELELDPPPTPTPSAASPVPGVSPAPAPARR